MNIKVGKLDQKEDKQVTKKGRIESCAWIADESSKRKREEVLRTNVNILNNIWTYWKQEWFERYGEV